MLSNARSPTPQIFPLFATKIPFTVFSSDVSINYPYQSILDRWNQCFLFGFWIGQIVADLYRNLVEEWKGQMILLVLRRTGIHEVKRLLDYFWLTDECILGDSRYQNPKKCNAVAKHKCLRTEKLTPKRLAVYHRSVKEIKGLKVRMKKGAISLVSWET